MASEIRQKAHEVSQYVIETRRTLHMHPEEGMHEFWTSDFIAKELDGMGIPYRRIEPAGLIAEIKGTQTGKTVALRADMDAMATEEKTGSPYASRIPGMMHACGHDTHVAMLLGAAKVLNGMKDQLHGTVRLIFQPDEENMVGARAVIRQGGIDGVDAIYGIHTLGPYPASVIMMSPGAIHAGNMSFRITVKGKTTHGAIPQDGVDATLAASAIVMNLQSIVSRELSPKQSCVVTVGMLKSGTRFNSVSGEAVMDGTCRYYEESIKDALPGILERIAENTAKAYRCTAKVECTILVGINNNNKQTTELMWNAAKKISDSEDMVMPMVPFMGSEDFAEYSQRIPSTFAFVGSGTDCVNHNNYFYPLDETLEVGTALHIQTALDYLNQ